MGRHIILSGWFYDENNNCVEYNFWGSSGIILERCLSYYEDNRLVQEIVYNANNDTELYAEDNDNSNPYYLFDWEVVFYDEKGNISRIEHYEPNGNYYWDICYPSADTSTTYIETYDIYENLVYYQESSFDDVGNRLSYLAGKSKNSLTLHYEFEYDSSGNKICTKDFDENGNLEKYTTFEYDLMGNLLIEANYDKDGNLTAKWIWIYDKYGNVISGFYEDKTGVITESTCPEYEYDENGCLIKKIYYRVSG